LIFPKYFVSLQREIKFIDDVKGRKIAEDDRKQSHQFKKTGKKQVYEMGKSA